MIKNRSQSRSSSVADSTIRDIVLYFCIYKINPSQSIKMYMAKCNAHTLPRARTKATEKEIGQTTWLLAPYTPHSVYTYVVRHTVQIRFAWNKEAPQPPHSNRTHEEDDSESEAHAAHRILILRSFIFGSIDIFCHCRRHHHHTHTHSV